MPLEFSAFASLSGRTRWSYLSVDGLRAYAALIEATGSRGPIASKCLRGR
jgi:hypothetical protein